jgi:hypothetical protein
VATQWTELLNALLTMEHVTVPAVRGNALGSVETMKRAYTEQLQYCNLRYVLWYSAWRKTGFYVTGRRFILLYSFLSRLQDLDFPGDLIDGVRNDLANPP